MRAAKRRPNGQLTRHIGGAATAGLPNASSSAVRGVSFLRGDILRNRAQPIAPAAKTKPAVASASISKSINISAVMTSRNATKGLSRVKAAMPNPRGQFLNTAHERPHGGPDQGLYYDGDYEGFIV
jgi:hypothetical protein